MREPVKPVYENLLAIMMNSESVELSPVKKEELLTVYERSTAYIEAIEADEWLILNIAADGTFVICSTLGNIIIEELVSTDLFEPFKDSPFPNGFDDWREIHFEVVAFITTNDRCVGTRKVLDNQGRGGLWELAKELTNKFTLLTKEIDWKERENTELSWYEMLDDFLKNELY